MGCTGHSQQTRQYNSHVHPGSILLWLLILLLPFKYPEAADNCGNNIVICSHASSYGDINATRAAPLRAKLSNSALFGPSGSLLPETFSFVSIPSISAGTLSANNCQIYFSGYDTISRIDAAEQAALNNWVYGASDRYIIGGCDTNGYDSVCDAVGRSVTDYVNVPVNLNNGTPFQNPLLCSGGSTVEISGGASGYFTNFGSDIDLAHYNDASAFPETITDSLTGNGKYLLTGDINMWVTPNPAISAGDGISMANDFFIANSFKFAGDNICGRIDTSGPICPGSVAPADYSDAPSNYGSPNHEITASLYLGNALPDSESSGQASIDADGDDNLGADDEDGVSTFPALTGGDTNYTIPIANITANGTGTLHAWIDFDGDGKFTATEYAATSITSGTLGGALTWSGQNTTGNSATYARFRLTSDALSDDTATATIDERSVIAANDGEVEDYRISIASAAAKIAGIVYQDDDGSNTQNGFEPGLPDITIDLFNDNGTPTDLSDDTLAASTSTTADGTYLFDGLAAATFRVSVDSDDPELPSGALIGTGNPVYGLTTALGTTSIADFGFDIFSCVPGGGVDDPAVESYISTEVDGNSINARNMTDTLDDDWRLAAGLPLTGTVIPWLGYSAASLANNETALFSTQGVDVGVALVNIQPTAPCSGNVHTSGSPKLSLSNTLQESSPRPASLYAGGAQPAFWNESSGNDSSPNAVRFTFAQPVKSFGAWFGDLETRTDRSGQPAYLRLLDSSGNRIGADIVIEPQTLSNGTTTSPVDQNQCGSTASNIGCGNTTTRWVGFVDNAASARIHQALIIVGDDDFGERGGVESLSFIGMDIDSGYQLSGRIFHDINVNAIDDAEMGIPAVTMVLHDTELNSCRSTQTDANGYYYFSDVEIAAPDNYVVYEAANENYPAPLNCPPIARDPNGFQSSTVNFKTISIINTDVTGVDFGDVATPRFSLDNTQTTLPNSSVTHPHIFSSDVDGSVLFTVATINTDPVTLIWGTLLFEDVNCDAQLDSNDQPIITGLPVNAGDTICILAKVMSPANASTGATHTLEIQSDFSYGNGSSGLTNDLQTHTNITTVVSDNTPGLSGGEGKLFLLKSAWNITRDIEGDVALPGEIIRYTIYYENIGSGPLNELVITDSVPEFTQLVPGSLLCTDKPAELPSCVMNGSLNGSLSWAWTTTGKLWAGSNGSVSFDVTIQ